MDPRLQRRIEIARALGCVVVETSTITVDGVERPIVQVHCVDNRHALRLLNALAVEDAAEPDIRYIAERMRRHAVAIYGDGEPLEYEIARRIHAFVQAHVAYEVEDPETFRSADLTLRLGVGDCDDHALCVASLAIASGVAARIDPVKSSDGEITHVCAVLRVGARWLWAETTIAAQLGEHPRAAGVRLRILGREDVTA